MKTSSRLIVAAVLVGLSTPSFAQTTQSQPTTTRTSEATTRQAPKELSIVERIIAEGDVTVAKLSNGLTVIVKPMRHNPIVNICAFVGTGAMYEGKWSGSGISHLTEHLIAKGAVHDMGAGATEKPPKQTSGRIKQIGAQSNASTSLDHTRYYISAVSGKTIDCIDLLADWIARPEITREDFEREHGVVQRELEMGEDDPERQMWWAHAGNFFRSHPARIPIIGYKEPLSKLTCEDVLEYHRLTYVPQNMLFVVVGDVEVETALDRVRKALRGFERGRARGRLLPDVPPIANIRRLVRTHKSLTEVMQRMSFRTIPLIHEDLYALDVLSYILTEGRSSRLYQRIRREKNLVTSISSSSWTPDWGAGMFAISFRCKPENADPAEQAIIAELRTIVSDRVDPDELNRSKRQKIADYVHSQQTIESAARTLGRDYMSTGDVNFSRNYTDRIQSVTSEDVLRVARKYFTFDKMAITRMEPEGRERAEGEQARTKPVQRDPYMITLPNALRVVLYPTDAVGLVSTVFVARGGVLLEDEKTNGMGTLMTGLATKGAGQRSAEQIAQFFDSAGGSISGHCGNNTFYFRLTVLEDSFEEALEILSDVIQRPTFSEKELEILRPKVISAIRRLKERPISEAIKFFRWMFFKNSPYKFVEAGTESVVSEATRDQIAAYHKKYILGGSSVLGIYGNFDPEKTEKLVEKLFANLPEGEIEVPPLSTVEAKGSPSRYLLKTNKKVAVVIVAAPGMKLTDLEDRYPMSILDTIISGWQLPAGWLHEELRGKQLVYAVHAYNWAGLLPGAFVTYAICQPEKVDEVEKIIMKHLDNAAQYEPTEAEVELAVNSILTAELLGNQQMSSLAMGAALDELYGFGYDFRMQLEKRYRQITPADVLRVGKKYLAKGYVTVITAPKDNLPESSK